MNKAQGSKFKTNQYRNIRLKIFGTWCKNLDKCVKCQKKKKISSQYLERFQIYCHLTEKFWQLSAYCRRNWPISYERRRAIARIFQLNDHNSETTKDIDLKFSAYVHHMSGLN